jgi:hypothetical protein
MVRGQPGVILDPQLYDLVKQGIQLAGTLGLAIVGARRVVRSWQAKREAVDAQQNARIRQLEERPCCVRLSGKLPEIPLDTTNGV